jgi:DNA-binding MarR family transcriptional regulator
LSRRGTTRLDSTAAIFKVRRGAKVGEAAQMIEGVDTRELSQCMFMRLRRVTRRLTQFYDHALSGCGLTATQYNILAVIAHEEGRAMGAVADWLGMDPTTLNRNLRPLLARRLVRDGKDARDGRIRTLATTKEGRAKLRQGAPLWREAQRHVRARGGEPAAVEADRLNRALSER